MVNADDNLVPGGTYTFTFTLGNLITQPSVATIETDLAQQAPDFISSVSVSWSSGLGLLTNYLNVTFTYTGDGSDIASDVWNAMIAAFRSSGDSFTFTSGTMGASGLSASTDIKAGAAAVGTTVGQAIGAGVGNAASAATANVGFDAVLVIGLLLVGAFILFELKGVPV